MISMLNPPKMHDVRKVAWTNGSNVCQNGTDRKLQVAKRSDIQLCFFFFFFFSASTVLLTFNNFVEIQCTNGGKYSFRYELLTAMPNMVSGIKTKYKTTTFVSFFCVKWVFSSATHNHSLWRCLNFDTFLPLFLLLIKPLLDLSK